MTKAQFRKAFPYVLSWKNDGGTVCTLRFETKHNAEAFATKVFSNTAYHYQIMEVAQ